MKLVTVLLLTALTVGVATPAGVGHDGGAVSINAQQAAADTIPERIRQLVLAASEGRSVRGEQVLSLEAVRSFYEARAWKPAWTDGSARAAAALIQAIRDAAAEGLDPADYHIAALATTPPRDLAEADVLLSDAFLTMAGDRLHGRVDPRSLHAAWPFTPRSADLPLVLARALDQGGVANALRELDPPHAGYSALRNELMMMQSISPEDWPVLPDGPSIEPGMTDARVPTLRRRLDGERIDAGAPAEPILYDDALVGAVRSFQRRHGLEDDGVVGRATRAALNVAAAARARQIALNLERWRWQDAGEDRRYIEVTIPAFELRSVDGDRVLRSRIVGGRVDWPTPIFGGMLQSIVFSPHWNVPERIAKLEVLPHARRDRSYLERNHIRVMTGSGANARVVDPATIDWSRATVDRFPYWFRQDPGPENPLGRVKFIFPNAFGVYLHDSPQRSLYARATRAYSHGCMRVEQASGLALHLLDREGWAPATVAAAMAAGVERTVSVTKPLKVRVIYRTAWVDEGGVLQFRDDLYGHDGRLALALGRRNAVPVAEPDGECAAQTAR